MGQLYGGGEDSPQLSKMAGNSLEPRRTKIQKLQDQRRYHEQRLDMLDEAIDMLEKNPELTKLIDLLEQL